MRRRSCGQSYGTTTSTYRSAHNNNRGNKTTRCNATPRRTHDAHASPRSNLPLTSQPVLLYVRAGRAGAERATRNAGCVLEASAGTSHHGLAPKERGLSPVQWHCKVHGPITTNAARRARAAILNAAPPPKRQRAQWRAHARVTQKPAVRRPQLKRRTTVLHRRREASRRRSGLV